MVEEKALQAEEDLAQEVEKEEEDPLLVGQRYLNIYHQIHIFTQEKRDEFDESLLQMPDKIREVVADMPGGRVMLEHLRELEWKKGIKSTFLDQLIGKSRIDPNAISTASEPTPAEGQAVAGGTVSLDPEFAKDLATSLATAFQKNNLNPNPDGNLNELSSVLSNSFNTYATNMQNLTEKMLSQNMEHIDQTQAQLQSKLTEQVDLQNQMQNNLQQQLLSTMQKQESWQQQFQSKLTEQIDLQNKMQSNLIEQINTQNKIQSRFEEHLDLQNQMQSQMQNASFSAASPRHPQAAAQMNAQNNNTNSTTINNISIDSSCFNGLSQTLKDVEAQRSADFQQLIEVLNKNFSTDKSNTLPILSITNSITAALRENNKKQVDAIKAFGETLTAAFCQTQKELAQTLSKSVQSEKIYIQQIPTPQPAPQPSVSEPTNKSSFIKNLGEKISETTTKLAQNLNKPEKEKNKAEKKENPPAKNEPKQPKEQKPVQEPKPAKEEIKSKNKENPKKEQVPAGKPAPKAEKSKTEKPTEVKEAKIEPTIAPAAAAPKPDTAADDFDIDALLQSATDDNTETTDLTAALDLPQNDELKLDDLPSEDLSLDDAFADLLPNTPSKDEPPASQVADDTPQPTKPDQDFDIMSIFDSTDTSEPEPEPEPEPELEPELEPEPESEPESEPVAATPRVHSSRYDDALLKIKNALQSDEQVSLTELDDVASVSLSGTAEDAEDEIKQTFVDTPIENSDFAALFGEPESDGAADEQWEYVDENGNPIADNAEQEWEYVDENGNPIADNAEQEWEYVDENGNPIADNAEQEWEYVDENGNPISNDAEQWEYVDENGNPISDNAEQEWEYVDENGNPITDDAEQEWEYVDENGNPIANDAEQEWEYVDENGNPITDDAASSNSEAEAQTAAPDAPDAPDAPVAAEIDAADTSEDIPFEALFASTDADTETAELPAEPAATADTSTAAQSPADLIAGLMAGHKAAPNDQSDDDDEDTENNTKDEDDDEDAPAEPRDFDDLARAFGIPLSASAKSTGSTSASPEIDDFALAFGHPTPSNKEE